MSPTKRGKVDENGQAVLSFASDLRNLSRTAALVEEIAEMRDSGKWRRYETAVGVEEWRECEFDYFLVACDVEYDDISKVLAWNQRGKELAPSMMSDEPRKRRPIEIAAEQWRSPTGESLVDRAARRGWTNAKGTIRRPPVPRRALAQARHGVTMDEYARLQREAQIAKTRRAELEQLVDRLFKGLPELELRYVRDRLTQRLVAHRRTTAP